jgi:hypothetical protein
VRTLERTSPCSPEREIEALIEEARRRQRRRRRAFAAIIAGVLVSGVGAAAISLGSRTPRAAHQGHSPKAALTPPILPGAATTLVMWPAGAPIFGTARSPGETVNVDDLATSKISRGQVLTDIAGTQLPYDLLAVGRWLVYATNAGTVVATTVHDLSGSPRLLGRATSFVPATNGQVLLVHADVARSMAPLSARAVSVASGARGQSIRLPTNTDTVIEGTRRGLLLISGSTLELWRPGRSPIKLAQVWDGSSSLIAADARLVAYGSNCRAASYGPRGNATYWGLCAALRIIDLVDGRRLSIPAPAGTLGWVPPVSSLRSPIAPDDTELGAHVAVSPTGVTRLDAIRLGRATTTVVTVPDSTAPPSANFVWSAKSSWLLYQGLHQRLHAYRIAGQSRTLGIRCCGYSAMASVPNQLR